MAFFIEGRDFLDMNIICDTTEIKVSYSSFFVPTPVIKILTFSFISLFRNKKTFKHAPHRGITFLKFDLGVLYA
jgi:hypothetical protein